MAKPIRVIVFFVVVVAWLPVKAQFLGFGFESKIELTKQDLDIMHRTVDEQVHGKPIGTIASWSNADSGNYGTIKLAKRYTLNGRSCETVRYTLATHRMPVTPEHYVLESCLMPDGTWKIA